MLKKLAFAGALLCACAFAAPAQARHHHRHHHHAHRVHVAIAADGGVFGFRSRALDARASGRPLELHPLLQVARQFLGSGKITRQPGPWCRDFVNLVARKAGYRLANNSRRAIDALRLGRRVSDPRPGDLVVMRHHVTIFAGYGRRGLIGLGGNQGHGGVTYSSFALGRVVGFVRL